MQLDERLHLAVAFGRSLLAYHVDALEPHPVSAAFAVTNRCNLRCSYCNTPFLDPTDLPLDKVALLFDRLRGFGVQRLGLTGGEPLVRKDIAKIITLAKERGFWVTLNSNLLLYPRRKDAVKDVDMFFTSLDGPKASHEAARGEDAYDGVIEAAGEIAASGKRLVAICVVTEHNLENAIELLEVARANGFRAHFQSQCTDTAIVRGGLSHKLTNERFRTFFAHVLERKRAGDPVASSAAYLEALSTWDDFTRTAVADPNARCAASRAFLYVDPQGNAYPCAYTKGKSEPVDMLGDRYREAVGRDTPCTRCSVGPYLEFNLLYQRPARAALSVLRSYI
jgi:MoaA/NifB/PqqE/SkfB family radical SAM enzyme